MDRQFLIDRIEATKQLIIGYEDALQFFADNGMVQSYSFNTGQSVTSVMRSQIASIRLILDGLYNRLATLEARVNGAAISARPSW